MHKFNKQNLTYMKIMKLKIFLLTTLLLGFYGCEKTVIAYPGNTQDTSPKAPEGAIDWQIDVDEDGKGKLFENSASGTTIGKLNATDDNPDDDHHNKNRNSHNTKKNMNMDNNL